ncbi:long-chain acyl-CoA synthetase [Panacagrimonas perspica]|uniref:Long-chain acyl-CoA synthetase n=1 Tax=Panacagrimonas perspica TaxID=381431 RepID=A0A4R7NYK3_9GAMM|nr:AMP-binding protein [Panacagrimonas perspica]TDU26414.1 long-chain acyl-CoA synthetase [Panacagrimonas perspica]
MNESKPAHLEGKPLPQDVPLPWVGDIPARGLAQCPDRTAVIFADGGGRTMSYRELERMTRAFCAAMRARGLVDGARVAYLGRNNELYMPMLFGALRAGCVIVTLNWRLTAPEIAYQLQDSGAAFLIADADLMPVTMKACEGLTMQPEILPTDDPAASRDLRRLMAGDAPASECPHELDQVVVQMYTSGTTGKPKGVQLTHGCLTYARHCEMIDGSYAGWQAGTTHLSAMPNFHIAGTSWMLIGLTRLSTMVLTADPSPANLLPLIEKYNPGCSFIVPTVIRALVDAIRAGGRPAPRMKQIAYGASAIGESLLREAMETFGCEFGQAFGMTEVTGTCTYLPNADHDLSRPQVLKSVGRPLAGMAVQIRDGEGRLLNVGEAGEIWVRTPTAMLGYWNLPKATQEALVDGWYRTGDGGRIDADGFLYLTDRIKDMIISGGENVYPVEIEERLRLHPAVLEAAVIGLPDPHWGEAVHAMVELRPGQQVEADTLRAFAREGLAGFKCPRSIRFTTALPRTASGKVQRAQVRSAWRESIAAG